MSTSSPDSFFSLDCKRLYKRLCIASIAFLFGQLAFSCLFSVNCADMQPSVLFLWSLQGYERAATWWTVAYSVLVVPLACSITANLRGKVSKGDIAFMWMLVSGVCASLSALPLLDLTSGMDGAGSLKFLLVYTLVLFLVFWLGNLYWVLRQVDKSAAVDSLGRWLIATGLLNCMTFFQWQIGFSVRASAFFRPSLFAICQWLSLASLLYLPAKVAQAIGDCVIEFNFEVSQEEVEPLRQGLVK